MRVFRFAFVHTGMSDNRLDRLIASARDRAIPRCPPTIESNVLRRLRVERAEAGERFGLDWLLEIFQQTRFATAAVVAALLISTTASMVATSAHANSVERRNLALNALGFDVFQESKILKLDE